MTKNQTPNWSTILFKKILAVFPVSAPAKIYRIISFFPPLKKIVNNFIKAMIPKTLKIKEGELELDQDDAAVSGMLALGIFEKTETMLFKKKLKDSMVVVDVGASIGYYTVIAGKHVGKNGKVFAFEPEGRNFSLLSRNIVLNRLTNVITFKMALASRPGEGLLYLDEDNKGHHSLSKNLEAKETVSVKMDTLDNVLEKYGSPKIDLIKIDIEGAEAFALEGMKKTIAGNPWLVLFTEFYPEAIKRFGYSPFKFLVDLKEMGFSLFEIDEDNQCLKKIENPEKFILNFPKGESFTNLYVTKVSR